MKKIRHLIEYAGLRTALFALGCLSLNSSVKLARGVAGIWFRLHGSRRRTAMDNIRRAGITTDDRECRRIASESFKHFATLTVESIKSDGLITSETWRDIVDVEMPPETAAVLTDPSKGIIVASAHLGNWEIAGQLSSFMKPVVAIARNMNNPYVDRYVKERSPRTRFRTTPKHDTNARRLLSVLKDKETLVILFDQHARDTGMMLDFFGIPASTHTSPAVIHLATKAPLCFGYCLRLGPMKYRLIFTPLIQHPRTANKDDDIRIIMQALIGHLEAAIRKNPEQYMWAHRRWRNLK